MKLKPTTPGLLSISFWVFSFILAFQIQPGSRYIWVPDTLLLLGFCPLLIARRARWLWLAFGICNTVIGWTLAMSAVLPDTTFDSSHMVAIKKHLELYHPFMVWLLIGFIAAVIGLILLVISLTWWLFKRLKSKQ